MSLARRVARSGTSAADNLIFLSTAAADAFTGPGCHASQLGGYAKEALRRSCGCLNCSSYRIAVICHGNGRRRSAGDRAEIKGEEIADYAFRKLSRILGAAATTVQGAAGQAFTAFARCDQRARRRRPG